MRILIFIFAACMFSSCVTWNKCAQKFGTGETHSITLRDTLIVRDTVYTPSDSLSGYIPWDMLIYGDTVTEKSNSGKLLVQFWKDQYEKMRYKAKQIPNTVYSEKAVPFAVKGDCPNAVVVNPDKALSWHAKLWKQFQFFAGWLVLAGLFILIGWLCFRTRTINIKST